MSPVYGRVEYDLARTKWYQCLPWHRHLVLAVASSFEEGDGHERGYSGSWLCRVRLAPASALVQGRQIPSLT